MPDVYPLQHGMRNFSVFFEIGQNDGIVVHINIVEHMQGTFRGGTNENKGFTPGRNLMSDRSKTKRQLMVEIGSLRSRIAQLEDAKDTSLRGAGKPEQASSLDTLTGLPSRAVFFHNLTMAVSTARQDKTQLAVLFICLDRFKLINDTLGHDVGNKLLKMVASRLSGCMRQNDTLCRPGRDEFMLLLSRIADKESAILVTERIFEALATHFVLDCHELVISASLGICMYPDGGDSAESLLKNAYSAMKQAKVSGTNQCRFFSPHLNAHEFSRLLMENELRHAVNRLDFSLRFQPQIELRNRKIIGMEALIRWEHSELGFVSPDVFIPLAEQSGLIDTIGEWVLRAACEQHMLCQKCGCAPPRTAVNLSPIQLHREGLVSGISKILDETGLDPHFLEVEITEGALLRDYQTAVTTLDALHSMGVQIAIDDFGTGYSSLAYLSRFPVSKLKIDKSFVSAVTTDQRSAAISRAIVTLAHNLGMRVIAEGIETVEQLDYLRDLNCDEIQGYLLAHPLTAKESVRFLKSALKSSPLPH